MVYGETAAPSGFFPGVAEPATWLLLLGASGLLVGAVLPWVTATTFIGTISKSGIDGDGVLTALAGVVIAGLCWPLVKRPTVPRVNAVIVLVLALLALAVCIYDIFDVLGTETAGGTFNVGVGLWGSALASALAVGGAAVSLVKR